MFPFADTVTNLNAYSNSDMKSKVDAFSRRTGMKKAAIYRIALKEFVDKYDIEDPKEATN